MFAAIRSQSLRITATFELSTWNKSTIKYSILLTSPQLPLAMCRNFTKLASEPDTEPSAMLFITEIAARLIWSLKDQSLMVSVRK